MSSGRTIAEKILSRICGRPVRAGEIVSTGNLVTTHFPEAGDRFRFTVEGIGSTEIVLAP